jgi:membrane protease YdiL (CAAX protease family)
VAPIIEELIFRHALLKLLRRAFSKKATLHIVSFSFMFIHLLSSFVFLSSSKFLDQNDIFIYLNLGFGVLGIYLTALLSVPSYLISSYVLTGIVLKSEKLSPSILLHILSNSISFALSIAFVIFLI